MLDRWACRYAAMEEMPRAVAFLVSDLGPFVSDRVP